MSRVQKGGAIFKPTPKARPRPAPSAASRQTSVLDATTEPIGLVGPLISQNSMQHTQVSDSVGVGSSLSQPSAAVPASQGGFQVAPSSSPSVPAIHLDQRPPSLSLSPPGKGAQPERRTLDVAPSRSSATPIAIGVPWSRSQRPSDPASSIATSSDPPPPRLDAPALSTPREPVPCEAEPGPSLASGNQAVGKRRQSTALPDDDDASSTSSKAKGGRGRRSRAPSLPPYDPDADPGEDLDPTVVTMASLCNDTGQGRVSSKAAEILNNHAAWKKQNREKRSRMRDLMEAKKYGRTEQEDETPQDIGAISASTSNLPSTSTSSASGNADEGFDYSQGLAASRYNVQVRIGLNGETVIDEESLVVNREETDETADYTHVTESDTSKFVNSGTYAKRFRGSRWSAEETELFYDALMQHGENYELIAYMLPGRDRKSCKNKFKVEDKRNPARINYCLNNRTAPDIAYLSLMTGKDFSGPTPEIRVPSRPPAIPTPAPEEFEQTAPIPKKRRTKASRDEGLLIIGDADAVAIGDSDS